MKNYFIGLDIGGTAIKGALLDDDGAVIRSDQVATSHDNGRDMFVDSICELALGLARDYSFKAVGLGVAGMLDPERTTLVESPNMPGLSRVPLKAMLEQRLHCPVALENDANTAALGELTSGAGRGHQNFLFFTLGTGVGSGLILNSCLWRGEQGKAGEFGHVTVYHDGEVCGCGKRGCLEAHSSGTAIVRMARAAALQNATTALRMYADRPAELTPKIVYQYAVNGDAVCRDIFEAMAQGLAIAIADVNNLLDIYVFIAGGGISRAYDLFAPLVMEEIDRRVFKAARGRIRLIQAQLGNDAGVYGAWHVARAALKDG